MLLIEKVGAVMVVGGGVAGIQAALELADSGYFVYLVESSASLGGVAARLDRTFPENGCSMCVLSWRMVRCGRHPNISLKTLTEVERIEGEAGDFTVSLRRLPRYVSVERCVGCGECSRRCPVTVKEEGWTGARFRKAIHIPYAQAVPSGYMIDVGNCRRFTGDDCRLCEDACPHGAVILGDAEGTESVRVGSIILAPGFRTFDPSCMHTLGYGVLPNVITSMDLERRFAGTGSREQRLVRPSDGMDVARVAFLQCIGSRDRNKGRHVYCSSTCCTSALKEALDAMDRAKGLQASIFFTDLRTMGKGCERYLTLARDKGVAFHRCRVQHLEAVPGSDDILVRYISEEGRQVADEFDLVVLSVGMEASPETLKLARIAGIETDLDGFALSAPFDPTATSRRGIYACGAFQGPADIALSVVGASAAAAGASIPLADVRYSLSGKKDLPPPQGISGEEVRAGVFVCRAGLDLSGVRDHHRVMEYSEKLPTVAVAEACPFACSQDSQDGIRRKIEQSGLNRVVVAGCRFPASELVFRETLRDGGIEERFLEMASPRMNDDRLNGGGGDEVLVHTLNEIHDAVGRVHLVAGTPQRVGVNPQALVVGGGVTGMVAALGFAEQGFPVHLIEKSPELGGMARHLHRTWKKESIPGFVNDLVARVKEHPLTTIHLRSVVTDAEGVAGNYRSSIRKQNSTMSIEHGVVVLAPGGSPWRPDEYGYGRSQRVVTSLEFDKLHATGDERVRFSHNFVFIQCVGSRERGRPYCSRVCCTHSLQSAIALKEENRERSVFLLYRDMRSYGQREELYRYAREVGIVFINYGMHEKPGVVVQEDELDVVVWDHVLHEPFNISADLVILASAVLPNPDAAELARLYGASLDEDGFLQEKGTDTGMVDVASTGVFFAGLAVHPKPLEESIAEARAAVARATSILSKRQIVFHSGIPRTGRDDVDG